MLLPKAFWEVKVTELREHERLFKRIWWLFCRLKVSACVGFGKYCAICLHSDTEPESLQNLLSTVSAVQFKGNRLWSLPIQVTLNRLFFYNRDLFSTLKQNTPCTSQLLFSGTTEIAWVGNPSLKQICQWKMSHIYLQNHKLLLHLLLWILWRATSRHLCSVDYTCWTISPSGL